ncbi:DMT family transporter [Capnocytophaga canimorsus]|uniref:Uncharacterized transporter n=1 Tax=Capnocytophaga canimorsus (strain 5) TaxID=860228 RepID=F9YPB5_CAPCC|nr:DMT family transporter [Capnocytophaga canimorsus]AEK23309.1 Uncharacterized transporter [Capnocytophaga canimorsus Cc5]
MMNKPRWALFLGVLCISIFPILIRMQLSSGLISAFYRMAIASVVLVPYAYFSGNLKFIHSRFIYPTLLCGVIFALDITVWNISIQNSSATQATLLTNLSPVWVGIISFLFLKNKPKRTFWWGVLVALVGVVVFVGIDVFRTFSLDTAFLLGILSGFFYALYILLSKKTLQEVQVIPFITTSSLSSAIFLFFINLIAGESFWGFSAQGWASLLVQGLVCQLFAWLLISYATQFMKATRVSLTLLSQAVFATFFEWLFLNQSISLQNSIGGILILIGITITFYEPKKSNALF